MGKKRRLNRFISKWLKSDLPEERSTVLLLGVTRIPTTPAAARRPCLLPTVPAVVGGRLHRRNSSGAGSRKGGLVRRNSSRKTADCRHLQQVQPADDASTPETPTPTPSPSSGRCTERSSPTILAATPPVKCVAIVSDVWKPLVADAMERSVDSIGTCSLDVDASADLSDWSDISSSGTLRSASIVTPSSPEPRLPSYLSLACSISGYSTTTHYDPVRFAAKSRDASPHRLDTADLTTSRPSISAIYSVQNNLLSPPNLVPLPIQSEEPAMEAQQRLHGEFYSSMKTSTYLSKETFTSGLFSRDATDNGCMVAQTNMKRVSYESKSVTAINGQTKCLSETSGGQEFRNGQETKSFIQQRVERLYGPGALAQGFFKPQKKRVSDCDEKPPSPVVKFDVSEPAMRQSTSSPTLPVLRHLRPEFRAQLPFMSPKRGPLEGAMQKSVTVPTLLKKEANGEEECAGRKEETNGHVGEGVQGEAERNGHYFLKILDTQTKRLLELASRVDSYISTPNLSEEVIGKLRSAAGKARLLVSQKMQQFRGLCTNNINRSVGESFPTTNEDLQGFWDMVMLQVDQVDAIFQEIEDLKANGWREPVAASPPVKTANGTASKPRKVVARPSNKPSSAASEEARKQREAQRRKMIEDRRKAMKIAQQNEPRIEIYVPDATS
ncbi:disks large-associated protein 2 isoform X2 [Leptinotarsa decemlineata]|uniref:disks large-associated protein 2 isoform X2 n=1 Tax=Leptinotarsa decemlineata TaxID=7539 RepID=UPI003D305504